MYPQTWEVGQSVWYCEGHWFIRPVSVCRLKSIWRRRTVQIKTTGLPKYIAVKPLSDSAVPENHFFLIIFWKLNRCLDSELAMPDHSCWKRLLKTVHDSVWFSSLTQWIVYATAFLTHRNSNEIGYLKKTKTALNEVDIYLQFSVGNTVWRMSSIVCQRSSSSTAVRPKRARNAHAIKLTPPERYLFNISAKMY